VDFGKSFRHGGKRGSDIDPPRRPGFFADTAWIDNYRQSHPVDAMREAERSFVAPHGGDRMAWPEPTSRGIEEWSPVRARMA